MCAASYDICCRDLELTKQARGKLAAAHTKIERSMLNITYKDRNLCQGEDNSHRYNQHCEKHEMVLGKPYQPPQRRPRDLACHHLETMRQEKTTSETSQAVERRPGLLERHDMAEDGTAQANLETACSGLHPTTGHYGCL